MQRLFLVAVLCGLLSAVPAPAADEVRLDSVLSAVVANEHELFTILAGYRPLVESYIQTVAPDAEQGFVPVSDNYFFGRLELATQLKPDERVAGRTAKRKKGKALSLFEDFHSATFNPESFARMLVLDHAAFDLEHYGFRFVRAEFLGEVRTLVFDVIPREGKALARLGTARFAGRIWVEDRDYHIVRYNGIYAAPVGRSFHFDSWRLELQPGQWLPAYVYVEEAERASKQLRHVHRGQTRLWGYAIEGADGADAFTQVVIDTPRTIDPNDSPGHVSPLESTRVWESEAEENVLQRLERAGLLAPAGGVDEVLQTVVTNLEVTNGLTIEPGVRCRVLLTTPLEAFTIGHTIVLSRGLIDVLPNEASLAMVLAHQLSHILSGHDLDTSYAFGDRMLVGDREAMDEFLFGRPPTEEAEADARTVQLLESSPYAPNLGEAGLFLGALDAQADRLPSLIRPHFGCRIAGGPADRLAQIVERAPELDPAAIEQIPALPLGGRVQLDAWNANVELIKTSRPALQSAREKMPFLVTPLMPYVARHGSRDGDSAGAAAEAPAATPERERAGTLTMAPERPVERSR